MKDITREEMLELVSVMRVGGKWVVMDVKGDVKGDVYGKVKNGEK